MGIPDETMVTGNYKVQLYDPRTNGFAASSPEIGMHVEIRDPDDKIILSKVYSSEGKFTFTSHMPGEHVICLYSCWTRLSRSPRSRTTRGIARRGSDRLARAPTSECYGGPWLRPPSSLSWAPGR